MFDTILAAGTVAIQIAIILIVIAWIAKAPLVRWVARNASILLRVLFVGAVIGSFLYQYVYQYEPCVLCWYQRIAVFSVAILLFTTNITKNALLRFQVLLLSSAGFAVALFHKYLELFPNSSLVCNTSGPSCTTLYVLQFGYVTIPMMSLTILLAGIIVTFLAGRFPHQSVAEGAK